MGNLTTVRSLRRLGLTSGLALGVVALALLAVLAIFLPKANGSESVSLPAKLTGGFSALDSERALPAGANLPDDYLKQQAALVRSIQGDYDKVYDEPVTFRAYANSDLSAFAIVTVFTGSGGSFGPNFGTSEQIQLQRVGDSVCVVTYAQDQSGALGTDPDTVTCQLPGHDHTVQVATNGTSLAATAKLAEDVEGSL